ncbi:THUMP domain-containing protein 1 homolog [Daktulosphaira vitifoliae]|uniref:THUMP domain-containing protein 1 homolog n=1 Tax=Daktulosphaira vitifoliae TaxID=58002 RepID=UPI0021AA8E13|nr:THUMP domain-containing protein 1 homolog [Daktulosphaira vitifoliae]
MAEQNKSKSSYFGKKNYSKDRFKLQPNMKGFLCTCNFNEKDCQKEAINLLREYSEEKEIVKEEEVTVENEVDIMDSIEKELGLMTKKDNTDWNKFRPFSTGVTNCIFIGTTNYDPCILMYKILEDIEKNKIQKTKFLLRMLPITMTCKANITSIITTCSEIFPKYFTKEPTTFAIAFNHRYNNSVPRNQIIEALANKVAEIGEHKVDLSGGAKMTIIVEVVKTICCLSVVKDYGRFYKFNLLSVCGQPEKRSVKDENDSADIQPKVIKYNN